MPKWRDIAEAIERGILDGTWPVGSTIPSYRALGATHGAAERTARRAVADLASRGILRVRHGAGVVVIATPEDAVPAASVEERLDDHEARIRALEDRDH